MPGIVSLQFDLPHNPAPSTGFAREDIAYTLKTNAKSWAIVARHDRMARAETMADRITDGREYGDGFEAQVVKVGSEIRVYARYVG
jgi:hypothetical protein